MNELYRNARKSINYIDFTGQGLEIVLNAS